MKYLFTVSLLLISVLGFTQITISPEDFQGSLYVHYNNSGGEKNCEILTTKEYESKIEIIKKCWSWQPGWGPYSACAMLNCRSDHKNHWREKYIIDLLSGEVDTLMGEQVIVSDTIIEERKIWKYE